LLQRLCVGPASADKRNEYDLRWRLCHALDQVGLVKRGRRPAAPGALAGHHDRVGGRSKRRMADLLVRLTVTRNRSLRKMGWRSGPLPPKWLPRAKAACRNKRTATGISRA
jgi:hypothetical protein